MILFLTPAVVWSVVAAVWSLLSSLSLLQSVAGRPLVCGGRVTPDIMREVTGDKTCTGSQDHRVIIPRS